MTHIKNDILDPPARLRQCWTRCFGGTTQVLHDELQVLNQLHQWADWKAVGLAAYKYNVPVAIYDTKAQRVTLHWSPQGDGLPQRAWLFRLHQDHFEPAMRHVDFLDLLHDRHGEPMLAGACPLLRGGAQPQSHPCDNGSYGVGHMDMLDDDEMLQEGQEWFFPVDQTDVPPSCHLGVITVNVGSLRRHLHSVLEIKNAQIIVVTETRATLAQREDITSLAQRSGWLISWGDPAPMSGGERPCPAAVGVAILYRPPLALLPYRLPQQCREHERSGRLHGAKFATPQGLTFVVIATYADTAFRLSSDAHLHYWNTVMDTAISATDVHWLVAGDFQMPLREIGPVQNLLDMGYCFDTADPVGTQPRQPTYMGGRGTVIDHIVASKAWWPFWESGGRLPLTTFPTHYPVLARWKISTKPPQLRRCKLPHRLPDQCLQPTQAEKDPSWPGLPPLPDYQTLITDDVDEAFKMWSTRWEQHMLQRVASGDEPPLSGLHRGRGQRWPWKDPSHAQVIPKAQISDQTRSLRELHSLLILAEQQQEEKGSIPTSLQVRISQLWAVHSDYLDEHLTFDADLRAAKVLVRSCLRDSEGLDQQLRRDKWRQSLLATSTTASARAYAAIKAPERHALLALANDEGCIVADPDKQADMIETFWQQVVGDMTADHPGTFPPHVLACLPQAPHWTPPPITCRQLVTTIADMRSGSAAGVDGWRTEELKGLPAQAVDELRQLLEACETTGQLPRLWQHALISLVPKVATCPEVHQLRPISVFSTIWRAYAKLRCGQLSTHLENVLDHWQHGVRIGRSPLDPVNAIGFHLDNARLKKGPEIFGISFDLVKMFDTIPHAAVGQLLSAWKIDEQVATLWMHHIQNAEHSYKLSGNYVTRTMSSSRGLAQGCPLSVMGANCVMAAIGHALQNHVDQPDEVLGSIFVDDIHIISTQAYHLQIIADYLQSLLQPLGMKIAKDKSSGVDH